MMAHDATPDPSRASPPPPVLTYSTEPPTAGVAYERAPDGAVRVTLPAKGFRRAQIDAIGPVVLAMFVIPILAMSFPGSRRLTLPLAFVALVAAYLLLSLHFARLETSFEVDRDELRVRTRSPFRNKVRRWPVADIRRIDVRQHVQKDEEHGGAIISHELYFFDPDGHAVSLLIKGDSNLLRTIADLLTPALPAVKCVNRGDE